MVQNQTQGMHELDRRLKNGDIHVSGWLQQPRRQRSDRHCLLDSERRSAATSADVLELQTRKHSWIGNEWKTVAARTRATLSWRYSASCGVDVRRLHVTDGDPVVRQTITRRIGVTCRRRHSDWECTTVAARCRKRTHLPLCCMKLEVSENNL